MNTSRGNGRTLRPVSAAAAFWLAVAVGGWAAFDAVRVDGLAGTRWAAVILIVLWVLWVLLWLPSIRIRENEIVVVNALRTWTIPWSRVEDVRTRLQYVLALDDGRTVTAWGSPFSGRASGHSRADADILLLANPDAGTGSKALVVRTTAWWSLSIPALAVVYLVAVQTMVA